MKSKIDYVLQGQNQYTEWAFGVRKVKHFAAQSLNCIELGAFGLSKQGCKGNEQCIALQPSAAK